MMDARRHLWLTATVLALVAAACAGGSGSSGFDITENVAIDQALDSQACVDFEGLMICPAGRTESPGPFATATPTPTLTPLAAATPSLAPTMPVDTPSGTPSPTVTRALGTPGDRTATPTATRAAQTPTRGATEGPAGMEIETSLSDVSFIDCPLVPIGAPCLIDFRFVPRGFPAAATYRVAVREVPEGSWTLLEAPNVIGGAANPAFDNRIEVPREAQSGGPISDLQFAVLVFLAERGDFPPTVEGLSETGADFAYVTALLPVTEQ